MSKLLKDSKFRKFREVIRYDVQQAAREGVLQAKLELLEQDNLEEKYNPTMTLADFKKEQNKSYTIKIIIIVLIIVLIILDILPRETLSLIGGI